MYQLYTHREKDEIKISKMKSFFRGSIQEHEAKLKPGTIIYYNTYYSFCTNRSTLVKHANELKEKWLLAAREKVIRIEQIEI